MKLLVLDTNASWVRSLVAALPPPVELVCLRVFQAEQYRSVAAQDPTSSFSWRQLDQRTFERDVIVPGWTRFFWISSGIVEHVVRDACRQFGQPESILYTSPYYAPIAGHLAHVPGAYYAHDVFRCYDWDRRRTLGLEKDLMERCQAVFAVAIALVEDFRRETATPVYHLPNATSSSFLGDVGPVPADLCSLRRPLVGCTGQINRSYDWDLIEALSVAAPDASFVFIGPVFDEPREIRRRIDQVLGRPNVHWLGPRPHGMLPSYLQSFDVCLNPLAAGYHADRRSPLRLFDYMSTSRPILSTAIREAFEHQEQVVVGRSREECAKLLRAALGGRINIDAEARRAYVRRHTWERRGDFLLERLTAMIRRDGEEAAAGRR
jgi:glycosyltransferase involved in cell wall biosynthesis